MNPFSAVASLFETGIKTIFPDTTEQQVQSLNLLMSNVKAQTSIILADSSGNWLQRSWRPILMLVVIIILINNTLLVSYFGVAPVPISEQMWEFIKWSSGMTIGGRTTEKLFKIMKS